MKKYKIYYKMEGDTDVWADSEEEARENFYEIDTETLAGETYSVYPEIDDIKCIGDDDD